MVRWRKCRAILVAFAGGVVVDIAASHELAARNRVRIFDVVEDVVLNKKHGVFSGVYAVGIALNRVEVIEDVNLSKTCAGHTLVDIAHPPVVGKGNVQVSSVFFAVRIIAADKIAKAMIALCR